jgi:HEPN domain-containing protein
MLEGPDPVTDMACFHCQQAVEKYFKAFLVFHHVDFEKVHNLFTLKNMCASITGGLGEIDLKNLNFFGVSVRYPEEFYIPSLDEAREYLAIARTVQKLVTQNIKL